MPNYEVAAPDGTKYQVTAPSGTPPNDVMSYVQAQHAANTQASQSPADVANAQGQAAGAAESPFEAGVNQAAKWLPFGLTPYADAGLRDIGDRLTGKPASYTNELAYSRGQSQGEDTAHPIASTIGGVIGGVMGAKGISSILDAAMPFKNALALKTAAQGGTKLSNAAKIATTAATQGGMVGATVGGVEGGVNNGDPSLTGAVGGIAEGAVGGAAAGLAGAGFGAGVVGAVKLGKVLLSDESTKAIAALAPVFKVSPTDLNSVLAKFKMDTGGVMDPKTGIVTGGRDPQMSELTDLYSRGEMQAMAGKSPLVGGALRQAAQDSDTALPGRMASAVQSTLGGEDASVMATARKQNFDDAMKPIRSMAIPLDEDTARFLQGTVVPNTGTSKLLRTGTDGAGFVPDAFKDADMQGLNGELANNHITLGNLDTLRQRLNILHQANPGDGYGALAQGVRKMATDASPEYGAALDQYATDSRYMDGYTHGASGKTQGQTADPKLVATLQTPEGAQGFKVGQATRLRDNAFASTSGARNVADQLSGQNELTTNLQNNFDPTVVNALRRNAAAELQANTNLNTAARGGTKAPPGVNTGQAALTMVAHSLPLRIYHGIQAHLGVGMSDGVARIVAKYLTDPTMTQQGINLMRAHGVSEAATRAIMAQAAKGGAVLGAGAMSSAAGEGQ